MLAVVSLRLSFHLLTGKRDDNRVLLVFHLSVFDRAIKRWLLRGKVQNANKEYSLTETLARRVLLEIKGT